MDPTVPRMDIVPPGDDVTSKARRVSRADSASTMAGWHAFDAQAVTARPPEPASRSNRMLVAITVVAVIVVASAVFILAHSHQGQSPGQSATVVTRHATSTAVPTPAPLSPDQAWPGGSIVHVPLALSTGETFTPTDVFPDGSALVGYETPASGSPLSIAVLSTSSQTVKHLYTLASDIKTASVTTDGRFVVYLASSQAGGGSLHQILGYFDLQSDIRYTLVDTKQQTPLPPARAIGNDDLLWASANSYRLTNMASFTSANVNITPANVNGATLGTWPYIFYATTDGTPHLYDLQTNVDTALAQFDAITGSGTVAVSGDQIFWTHAGSSGKMLVIDTVEHAAQTGATLTGLLTISDASVPTALFASDRFFVLAGQQNAVWDRTEQKLVALPAPATSDGFTPDIHGNILWYSAQGANGPEADLVNASLLAG